MREGDKECVRVWETQSEREKERQGEEEREREESCQERLLTSAVAKTNQQETKAVTM